VVEQRESDPVGGVDLPTGVVQAFAAAEEVNVQDVLSPPLSDVLDAAAIEAGSLAASPSASADESPCVTRFGYRGRRMTLRSTGWVRVADSLADGG
jgi:hypothetical protein